MSTCICRGFSHDPNCPMTPPVVTDQRADHPHTNPGDGRPQCPTCGKFVWPVIHSCKGIRVAPVDPTSPEWR